MTFNAGCGNRSPSGRFKVAPTKPAEICRAAYVVQSHAALAHRAELCTPASALSSARIQPEARSARCLLTMRRRRQPGNCRAKPLVLTGSPETGWFKV